MENNGMNRVMETITTRRSIRRYKPEPLSGEALSDILQAVYWSPSWANTQCWEIVVVRDQAVKEQLQETLSPKNPASLALVSAPMVLAVCGREKRSGYYREEAVTMFGDWMLYDLGIATQNILLAASSHGLGTVVVGAFDHGRAGTVLSLPPGYQVATLIPVGLPAHEPGPPKRRPVDDFVHYDSF